MIDAPRAAAHLISSAGAIPLRCLEPQENVMAEDRDDKNRDRRPKPVAEEDEHKHDQRSEKDTEGRDTPPSDRGRDRKSPWLGGG
jgi:hypothetical protein